MEFTYAAYRNLITELKQNAYQFCGYFDYANKEKSVIMRHDIDYSLEQSVKMAQIEQEEGISSTYFVLLKTDFYNPVSKRANDFIREIKNLGHEVGLHFDETVYAGCDVRKLPEMIQREADILSDICGFPVRCFSMHRPNQVTLGKDLQVDGLVNSYGHDFFHEFKYLSDSRRNWREPVEEIVRSGAYDRLHILTHAFWYHETEMDLKKTVLRFIRDASKDRYGFLDDNIRDLGSILDLSEL